jgi:2-phospho-L-lactate guanylyltransferase
MLRAMRVLAVPVKSLERAKTRLSPMLSPAERAALSLVMLEDVLDACVAQDGWETWIVSHDEAVLETGVRRGARPVIEKGRSLLEAIRQLEAEAVLRNHPAGELAVILADLPLITEETVRVAITAGRTRGVVAAPAASDGGTNLLLRRPPSVIAPRFGRASFAKHRWAARRARVPFEEIDLPQLAFDVDRPEDLARIVAARSASRTRSACLEMGVPERLRSRVSAP